MVSILKEWLTLEKKQTLRKPLKSFVILSYAIFFVFFIIIGISMMLGAPKPITNILQIISAWSSTFAFFILFNRIFPGLGLKSFVKTQFAPKLKLSVLGIAILIQVIIIALTIILINQPAVTFTFSNLGLLSIAFLDNLIRGPLGEELGWRGYALNELQKKYSPLKSALIIGVLWGFWHTPLWFASGYTGMDLMKYIVLFMIGILSFSIILTFFYNLNKNLLIPIVMHQIFNFSLVLIKGDLLNILTYIMLAYAVVAVILVVLNPRKWV